jgi:hypothetical protein
MERRRPIATIEAYVRAFAVRTQGRSSFADVESYRRRLEQRGIQIGPSLDSELEAGRAWFTEGRAHLAVCGGGPCRRRGRDFDGLVSRLQAFEAATSCRVSVTECQGPCKQAPVATLRVNERSEIFAQVFDLCDWEAVLDYGGRAVRSGTLLCDPGSALPFRFDPVHAASHGSGPLRRLSFLVGHFLGTGRYAERSGEFHKEVLGAWETGGRFLGLRMAVIYPLEDGRKDVHQALVVVGYNDTQQRFEARAFTDSGTTRDYALTVTDEAVVFEDRVPGHGVVADRARKVLSPRAIGFDEILELQTGDEAYRPYSRLELRPAGQLPRDRDKCGAVGSRPPPLGK